MKSKIFNTFLFLLTTCICFGNIGGAFQVDRILAVLFLPWFLLNIGRKGCNYAKGMYQSMIVIFLYMLVSYIWTPDRVQATKELVYYLVHFILFLEIIVFARFADNPLKIISRGWMIAVLLCSVVAYWEISTGNHLSLAKEQSGVYNSGVEILVHNTASVTFNNYNSYVTFLCFSFPWLFYVLLDKERKIFEQIIAIVALIAASITLIYNASRGGVLSLGIMLVTYWIFSDKSNKKNVLLFALILLFGYWLIRYGGSVMAVLLARSSEGGLITDAGRSQIWMNALKAFGKTWGFGVGIGGIIEAMREVSPNGVLSPHNLFLEILVQYGLIISIVVLAFFWRLFKKSLKVEKNRKCVLMMALLALPIYSIIDSGYLLNVHFYVFLATVYVFANYEHIKTPYNIVQFQQ